MSRTRRSICLPLGLLFLVIAATVPGGPRIRAHAQTITPRAALVRVLSAPREQPGWFAPLFLAQVSVAQVEQGIAGVKAQFGPYKGVAPRPDGSYLVTFARGSVQAQIHLDGQGRIDGLLFTKPRFTYVSRAVAFQGLRALPGQVSLLVTADGAPLTSLDPDRSLAVGSAFKLAVLTALQGRIKAGELSWTQQVTLHASDKSLPGGVLQTKPDGSRYTVADLARYMISISDNTAADLLIRLVGRPAIDPLIPARDRPILTTRWRSCSRTRPTGTCATATSRPAQRNGRPSWRRRTGCPCRRPGRSARCPSGNPCRRRSSGSSARANSVRSWRRCGVCRRWASTPAWPTHPTGRASPTKAARSRACST